MQTVASLVERFGRETGIAVFFQNECDARALAPAQEIQVFYIIQEALTNIRKHSGARNVRIMLNNEDDLYTVLIEDDGLGIADIDEGMPAEHAGLAIMRERTAASAGPDRDRKRTWRRHAHRADLQCAASRRARKN